jgi:hypothetical protein
MLFRITSTDKSKLDNYIALLDKQGFLIKYYKEELYNYSYYTIEIDSLSDLMYIQAIAGFPIILSGIKIEIYDKRTE